MTVVLALISRLCCIISKLCTGLSFGHVSSLVHWH